MALYYTFLAFLDSRACWFFSEAPKRIFPLKKQGSTAGSIILRLNWDEKDFDLRFFEKNEKIKKLLDFRNVYFVLYLYT